MAKSVGSLVAGRASTDSFDGIIGFRTERENRMATTRILSISIALALAAGSGCVREVVDCAGNPSPVCADTGPRADTNSDAFSLFDAHTDDVGADAFNQPDSGLDGGICSRCPTAMPACLGGTSCVQCTAENTTACDDDAPACDTETNTCVECNTNTDCTGDTTPVCDVEAHRCVPCLGSDTGACGGVTPACDTNNTCTCTATSCTSATAARCDETTNACVACTADTQCAHLGATPVCDEERGACVACTGDTEAARCGMNSCRRSDGTCTMRRRGLSDTCDTCEADSECTTGQRCVRHVFGGTDVGSFCFLDAAVGGCGDTNVLRRPYSSRTPLSSIDGVAGTYCLPPSTTTCQGIRDTRSEACTMDSECGDSRVADGFCPTTGTGAGLCSYACSGGVDCSGTLNCGGTPQHCRPPL